MASMVSADQDVLALPLINGVHVDFSSWPTPDEGALQGDLRLRYFARKKAVQLFLAGASESVIKAAGSIGAKQAYRLVRERCLAPHSDGLVYGWRGLIPYLRIQSYHRRKKIRVDKFGLGAAGAMQTLLDLYPELRRKFEKRIFSSHSVEGRRRHAGASSSHRWFSLRGVPLRHGKDAVRPLGLPVGAVALAFPAPARRPDAPCPSIARRPMQLPLPGRPA